MDENNPLQPTTPNLAPEAPAEPLTETSATADPTTNQPADDSVNFNTEPVVTEPEQVPSMSAQTEAPAFAPAETPKKKSNVLTLIFALIAVLGICFGIYGMFLQPEKEKVVYKTVEKDCDCSKEIEDALSETTNCSNSDATNQESTETPSETPKEEASEETEDTSSNNAQETTKK